MGVCFYFPEVACIEIQLRVRTSFTVKTDHGWIQYPVPVTFKASSSVMPRFGKAAKDTLYDAFDYGAPLLNMLFGKA